MKKIALFILAIRSIARMYDRQTRTDRVYSEKWKITSSS